MLALSLVTTGTAYFFESWDGLRSEVYRYNNTDNPEEKSLAWNRAVDIVADRYGKYIPLTCLKLAGHTLVVNGLHGLYGQFAPKVVSLLDFLVQRLKLIWNNLDDAAVVERAHAALQEMMRSLEEFVFMAGIRIGDSLRAMGENLGSIALALFNVLETVAFFICTSISNEFTIYCVQVQGIYKGVMRALRQIATNLGIAFNGWMEDGAGAAMIG